MLKKLSKRNFFKGDLFDLLREDHGEEFEKIKTELVGTTRWSRVHEMIFKFEGRFYSSSYRTGATEPQDASPYEYEGDVIECVEVQPVEKVVIKYEPVEIQ